MGSSPPRSHISRLLRAEISPHLADQTFISTLARLAASSSPTATTRTRQTHVAARLAAVVAGVVLVSLCAAYLADRLSGSSTDPAVPVGPVQGTVTGPHPPSHGADPAGGDIGPRDQEMPPQSDRRPTEAGDTVAGPAHPAVAASQHPGDASTPGGTDLGVRPEMPTAANLPGGRPGGAPEKSTDGDKGPQGDVRGRQPAGGGEGDEPEEEVDAPRPDHPDDEDGDEDEDGDDDGEEDDDVSPHMPLRGDPPEDDEPDD